ncbi:MAG TPA: TetR/AcrR family transcriptional regulator C-terminal domain-containing protein [Thermomicrobiales bacterium]|nr:TetR/AcrR family transcriptional regulator C-terminal domain-containing protein [Thermomicrobiales bacterium]
MTTRTDRSAEARLPLSRERVLAAAIRLADEHGVEALTMRRLGQALGVEAMSLYNHVANKEDILYGIAEMVFSKIELPDGDDWKAELRKSAISSHDVFRRHPWAPGVLSPERISPARMLWMEAVLRTLRKAGCSPELACHAFHAYDSHITGFTLWLANMPATGEALRELAADFLKILDARQMPYVAEHIEQHTRPPREGDKGAFAFGLDLLLDGVDRLRDDV